ncbi:MAG: DUF3310 domain-containing protein [Corynebacterium sp.]|jgi:hypothetical protein|nr:DUF3310 domain-containing protein [Corynebacterium sp.]
MTVDHPPHYASHPSGIECIEVSRHCMSDMGQAIQYVWRHAEKNGIEDLDKARWFLLDHVAHGFASALPYRARVKLEEVNRRNAADSVEHRVFGRLLAADPHGAIAVLSREIGG